MDASGARRRPEAAVGDLWIANPRVMFDNRNLRLDLFALALLAFVVFLTLALCTYDPADPVGELVAPFDRLYRPDALVYPQPEEPSNACGRWGALTADLLLTGLGLGAYYFVFSLAALDVVLLRRQGIDSPMVRTLGWTASLVGLATLAALVAPGLSPGPVIGSGGYLGALAGAWLQSHFALGGSLILSGSLILGGLLVSTDYALAHIAVRAAASVWRGLLTGRPRLAAAGSLRRGGGGAAPAAPGSLSVRIRGRRMSNLAQEEVEDGVDEAPQDEQERQDEESYDEHDDYEDVDDADELEEQQAAQEPDAAGDEKTAAAAGIEQGDGQRNPRPGGQADKNEREQVIRDLEEASRSDHQTDYELPDLGLLIEGDHVSFDAQAKEVRRKAKILEKTFADFGFRVRVVEIETGPVIAQYEVELEAGLRLSRITGLADDLAIALRVPSVRIVAPIPGKNTVGIEVPNDARQLVHLREVIEESNGKTKKMRIPIFLGKDVSGKPLAVDLSTLPHLLIAGRTGTGKSVCLNAIITSILMTRRPDEVRMLLVDPKMVELSGYGRLPHLMHPVVTDMRKAEAILAWAVEKMEERYALLARAGVRHVASYNQLGEEELLDRLRPENEQERKSIPVHLPFIVFVADEMADLMMMAGKEAEQHIIRLAQKSRAVGIHLVLATQKPTVDVITGLIKSNLPARISFQVASRTDSRVVLDEMGAEKLLGNGDMLFLWPGTSTLLRGQGTYLSDEEINSVVDAVSTGEQNFVNELLNMKVEDQADAEPGQLKKRDELYESAVDIVVREGRGSVSLLQRALGIGYGRAARLIDYMAEDNVVGAYAGSQAREVLITVEDWEKMQGASENDPLATTSPKPRRSNKILPSPDWDEEDKDDEQFEDEEEEEEDDDEDDEDDEEYDEDNEAEDNDEDARDEEGDEDLDEEESGLGAAGGRRDGGSVRRKAEGA